MHRDCRRLVCAVALLFVLTPLSRAQFNSAIQGTVTDQSGAVLPNAEVTLRNTATGVVAHTRTSDSGVYRFNNLQPAQYEISASAASLHMTPQGVTLLTDQTAGVNLTLTVASASQQVNVSDVTPAISTDDSRLETTIRTQQLQDIPVQGRNFLGLVAIAPGITGPGAVGNGAPGDAPDNFSTEKTVNASGNGRNQAGNEFTLDGLNITSNILQGTANLTPNPDSVQELSVQTNTFNVEHGRGSSVQVAITSRSGTNEIHGTGSYFFTNQDLRARTEFTQKYFPFKRHDFAGTLGGPIWKNHTFLFASVEPLRSQTSSAGNVITYESPEFVQFARQNFPNSIGTSLLTQNRIVNTGTTGVSQYASDYFGSTCGTAATAFIPCNLPVLDAGRFQPSPFRNALQYSFRADQYLRDGKDRFYFNLYKTDLDSEVISDRQGFHDVQNNNTNAYQFNFTHAFSPTVINEFSYGQIRVQGLQGNQKGIPFHLPNVYINKQSENISPPWGPATFIQHNYNWRDVLSWAKSTHSLKFGFEYWNGDDDAQFAGPYVRPNFRFNNLLDLVRDQPYQEDGVNFNPVTGQVANGAYRHLLDTFGAFVQDEWKMRPNLTVTIGLRWDDYGNAHPDTKTGPEGNIYIQGSPGGSPASVNNAFANAVVRSSTKGVFAGRLNNNWSPRVGVAYDPTRNGNWVIRGGIGLYHDWVPLGEANRVRQNPPGLITPQFRVGDPTPPLFSIGTSDAYPFGFKYPAIPTGAVDARGGVVGLRANAGGIDRHLSADNLLIYNIGFEHKLGAGFVAGATYSGSHLWDGLIGSEFNRFPGDLLDGKYDRLNSSFGNMYYEFNGNTLKYNAGIFVVRWQNGRSQWQASYTVSHVTDYGQAGTRINRDPAFATPTQYNLSQYEAPADWDVKSRFSFSGTIELPGPRSGLLRTTLGGWEVGSVWILQSGTPFTVFTDAPYASGGDYNADGTNYDWPSLNGKLATSYSRSRYIHGVFPTTAFAAPTPGTEGNERRASFRNPGLVNIDASLIKNNRFEALRHNMDLQLRFEFFNVLNRVNLQGVDSNLNSATFGQSTRTYDPRIIQLGTRLVF